MIVPACARYQWFLDKLTLLPFGARCFPGHLSDYFVIIVGLTDFSISSKIRFQSLRFDGIINKNTWHCTFKRKSEAHGFWQQKLSLWCRYFKLDRTNPQHFLWPVWNHSERNLKKFSHSKCTDMSGDSSYVVKCWNAKQNYMFFI